MTNQDGPSNIKITGFNKIETEPTGPTAENTIRAEISVIKSEFGGLLGSRNKRNSTELGPNRSHSNNHIPKQIKHAMNHITGKQGSNLP